MKRTLSILTATLLLALGTSSQAHTDAGHNGAEGGHMDHMGHMNNVLKTLKRELGDEYNTIVAAASKEQLTSGKKIFTESCVTCHGTGGKGDGPAAASLKQKPADFTDAEHSKFYSDQGRIYLIKKGSAGTAMPAWENLLSQKDIRSVYAYIRSLRMPVTKGKQGHDDHSH